MALDIHNLVPCHVLEEMGPVPVTSTAWHGVDKRRCCVLCRRMAPGCQIHKYCAKTFKASPILSYFRRRECLCTPYDNTYGDVQL